MRGDHRSTSELVSYVSLESRVPKSHPFSRLLPFQRRLDRAVSVRNVGDVGSTAAKGFGTGLAFRLVGSTAADGPEIALIRAVNGNTVTKTDYKQVIHGPGVLGLIMAVVDGVCRDSHETIKRVFNPPPDETSWARRVPAELPDGSSAVMFEGEMRDDASLKVTKHRSRRNTHIRPG